MNIYLVFAISGDCVVSITAFLDPAKAFEYAAEARKTVAGSPVEPTIQIATLTVGWKIERKGFLWRLPQIKLMILGAQENAEGAEFYRMAGSH